MLISLLDADDSSSENGFPGSGLSAYHQVNSDSNQNNAVRLRDDPKTTIRRTIGAEDVSCFGTGGVS